MTVGLFGGSFNPPHIAHLIVAETIREACGFEYILWMPAADPPHKVSADLASPEDRLAMTRLAVAGHPGFRVSDLELRRSGPSYTVDTVRELTRRHPDHSYRLIVGGDSLTGFPTWVQPEEILHHVSLIAYPRGTTRFEDVPDWVLQKTRIVEAPLLNVSGTLIRDHRRAGRSIRYLVPEAVRTYIIEHQLFVD